MSLSNADVTVIAVAAGLMLVVVVWALLSRRATARRLAALTARMGESDLQFGGRAGLETGLAKLERVVDSTVAVASEARSGQALMEQALAAVPQGVVVGDDQAAVVFQNAPAAQLLNCAPARDAVRTLLDKAADGVAETVTVEVDGPPAQTLHLRSQPLHD